MFMSSFLRLVAVNWSPLALRQSALFCYTETWVTTFQSVRWIHMWLRYHMASSIDAQLHFAMEVEGIHIIYIYTYCNFMNSLIYTYIHKLTKCDLMKWWHDVIGHRTPGGFWRVIVDSAIMFLLWRFSSRCTYCWRMYPNPVLNELFSKGMEDSSDMLIWYRCQNIGLCDGYYNMY